MVVDLVNDGPFTLVLETDATSRAGGSRGRAVAWPPHVPRRLRSQPVRDELLAARGRGHRGAVVVDPGLRARDRSGRCSTRAAARAVAAALLTHGHPDHAGAAAAFAGADVPVYVHPDDVAVFRDPAAWGRRRRCRRSSPRTCGRWSTATVLELGGVSDRGRSTRPGTRPARAASSSEDDVARVLGRPRVRGHDRPLGLPRVRPGRDGGEPAALPDAARRSADPARARARRPTVGRERATNPFLRELA